MKFTTRELQEKLKIDGYKLELLRTWDQFGQARLICYVSNEVCSIRRLSNPAYDSIPNITLEVGIGRAKKTLVHFYYREWKNGVTGDDSQNGLISDLKLHVEQWTELAETRKDFVLLGDANLCTLSWNEPNYQHKELADQIQQFLVDESCFQIVNKVTRVQNVRGALQKSCLDHITTNVPEKCGLPEVFPSGSSDHLPIMVTKYNREYKYQPKTIKKRSYQNFNAGAFLSDVYTHVVNGSFLRVTENKNPNEASAIFSGLFGMILNKHAPLKTFQVRSNYVPWISAETQNLIQQRNRLQIEAINEDCSDKYDSYKELRNTIQD